MILCPGQEGRRGCCQQAAAPPPLAEAWLLLRLLLLLLVVLLLGPRPLALLLLPYLGCSVLPPPTAPHAPAGPWAGPLLPYTD